VIAVLTPEQMKRADEAALAGVGANHQQLFIQRAGYAVAVTARRMMAGCYGKRVTVIAGKGHNGDDGRVAASHLSAWGAAVSTVDAEAAGELFLDPRQADLVIDAAYGIGFRGTWSPPVVFNVPVLAVDIPSGLNALNGTVEGGVLVADRTVTFAAPKTGMMLGDGPALCGEIDIIDVGIDVVEDVDTFLVQSSDIAAWMPIRDNAAHKWNHAVRVVAGSPGMGGASSLVSAAAMRAGAGIVHLSWRVGAESFTPPTEIVGRPLPQDGWAPFIDIDADRFDALVIGPGLGRGDDVTAEVHGVLAAVKIPAVVDGDGIHAAIDANGGHTALLQRNAATILTPHDGEFASLGGDVVNPDRIAATRELAARTQCIVLRKGPTTIVSDPDGAVYLVVAGDERLATAGSGDVLSGIIGAFIARGLAPHEAAAAAAHVHGMAGSSGPVEGLIARDLVALISDVLSEVVGDVR
jgi:NAD(P)H-hydrate epimerase